MEERNHGTTEARMAKTTVELPAVLHKKLRVKAALENCSMNDIIVAALRGHLHNFRLEPGMLEMESVPRERNADRTVSKEG
jgi:hypothetical protein